MLPRALTPPPVPEHPLFTGSQSVGMITGVSPRFPSDPGGHEGLKRDLQRRGARFEETWGKYGGVPERTLLVYGLPREHLVALGQKYGQEAVIHSEGGQHQFIYTNGPKQGQMHVGTGTFERWPEGQDPPADEHTRVPGHGHLRLHFDWDNSHAAMPVQAQEPAPSVAMSKHEIGHALYKAIAKAVADNNDVERVAADYMRRNGLPYEQAQPVPHDRALAPEFGQHRPVSARNLGPAGMSDPVKKSQRSQHVAETKTVTVPEALHGLYKTVKERVTAFEEQCLELRKAELEKKSPPGRKEEVEKLKAKGLPAHEAFGIAWKQQNEHGEPHKKDEMGADAPPSPLPNVGAQMSMAEHDLADPLCKCGSCSSMDAYAKGEMPMAKTTNPVIAARMAANKAKAKAQPKPEEKPASAVAKGESCKACGEPMAKCNCGAVESYAKGELKMAKALPGHKSPGMPAARESAGQLMDTMLADSRKPLAAGQPLAIKPVMKNPLTPVGARADVGGGPARPLVAKSPVRTALERSASRVPAPTAGLTPPPAGARPGAMSPILARHLGALPQRKSELPAGSSPDSPGPKGPGKPTSKPEMKNADGANGDIGKAEIKKAGAMPTAGVPAAPKAPGAAKLPKLPGPKVAKPVAPKTPAMGAGQPALKAELKKEHVGFNKLAGELAHEKGVDDPKAVAAAIGRKKYGAKRMAAKATAGKK